VRFNAPADVLATITDVQDINPQWSRGVTHSMVQTLVVLVLVTAGLSVASLWLAPKVDALYVQLDQTPPPAARFLSTLRNGLPIWSAATALLLIIFIFLWKRFGAGWASRWANQLPITRRRLHLIRSAELADYLAHWLQQDLPIVDGIRLASGLSDAKYSHTDSKPEHPRQYAPAALTDGDDPHHPALPPLVHWAIADEQSSEPIPLRLQSVASIYRQLANRLFVRWTRLIPITLAAGFCGLAVLIYGLSVFLPIIGLLQDVSAPPVLP
jgi:type II secretory pathway component PulF